jgi:hypothetical protein
MFPSKSADWSNRHHNKVPTTKPPKHTCQVCAPVAHGAEVCLAVVLQDLQRDSSIKLTQLSYVAFVQVLRLQLQTIVLYSKVQVKGVFIDCVLATLVRNVALA